MSYHAGLGRGDIGGPDRLRAPSGSGPAVPPFGNNNGMASGAMSGMSYGSSSGSNTGMVSGGGNLGATSSSRGLQSQTWGTGPSANSDTGEPLHHCVGAVLVPHKSNLRGPIPVFVPQNVYSQFEFPNQSQIIWVLKKKTSNPFLVPPNSFGSLAMVAVVVDFKDRGSLYY